MLIRVSRRRFRVWGSEINGKNGRPWIGALRALGCQMYEQMLLVSHPQIEKTLELLNPTRVNP